MKYISLLAILYFLLILKAHGYDVAEKDGVIISAMTMYQEAGDGCGCYFYFKKIDKNNFVLFWPINNTGTGNAIMKINNKLENIGYVYEKLGPGTINQSFEFKNKKFHLSGKVTELEVCGKTEEYCETSRHKGGLTLKTSSTSINIPIDGTCGC